MPEYMTLATGTGLPPEGTEPTQRLLATFDDGSELLLRPDLLFQELLDGIGQPNQTQPEYPEALSPWDHAEGVTLGFDLPMPASWVLLGPVA